MSIERVFHCDGPDCERHMRTSSLRPALFLTIEEGADHVLHFCGWDCVLKYAAAREPETVIPGPLPSD